MSFVNQYRSTTIYGELKVQKYNTGNIAGLLDVSGNTILRGGCIINGNLSATDGTIDISGNLNVSGDISGNLSINASNNTNDFFRVPFLDSESSSSTLSSSAGLKYNPVSEQVNYTTLNGGDIYALDISCNNVNAANFIGNVSTTTEDSSNVSFFPTFVSAEGNVPLKVNSGLIYNPFTETLDVTNINGTITNNSTTSTIATVATDASFYPTFVSATSGNLPLKVDSSGLSYNPFTNILSCNVSGNVIDTNALTSLTSINGANFLAIDNFVLSVDGLDNLTTGEQNVAILNEALRYTTTGQDNIAIGYQAMKLNQTGSINVAIGSVTLDNNISGNNNIAIGKGALDLNTTANENVAVGTSALSLNTTGAKNTALGADAGRNNITGSNNTFLGNDTDISGNVVYNNSTAIGYGAIIDASNCIVIGRASETVKIRGGLTVSGNITGTASSVVAAVATTGLFPIALATADTGSSSIKTDGGNFYYNSLTKILLIPEIQADYMRTPLSGVWLVNGNNTNSISSIVPLFCSQTNLGDINDQSSLTLEAAVTAAGVTGTLVNPFDVDNTTDLVIIMPKWGIRGFADAAYSGTTRINVHNQYDIPIYVSPSVTNSISSCRIYYNKVQITGQGS